MGDPTDSSTQTTDTGTPAGAVNTGTNQQGQPTTPPATATPPAPEEPPKSWDEIFKHPRFKQLLDKAKAAEDALAAIEKAKKDAADEEAKKRGEFEKLLDTEKQAHTATKAELRKLSVAMALRDYLSGDEKRQPYAGKAKYIEPFIVVADDADEAAIKAAVQKAADQWITDNPIAPTSPGGPTNRPAPGGGPRMSDEERRKASYQITHL